MNSPEEINTGPVVRDLRRIDPATGQVRRSSQEAQGQPGASQQPAGKPPRPGKHAAAKPGGAPGPGRPTGTPPTDGARPGTGTPPAPGPAEATGDESLAAAPAGEPRTAPGEPGAGREEPGGTPASTSREQELASQLAERTADLQRLSAEYANYRKRVDRDRLAVREQALANVLVPLLPVLDDIGRAREHGELVGGFKPVAESLEAIIAKLGLTRFGEQGEPFDPNIHEALMHSYSAEVTEPTCVQILQPGYRVGERIVRPARVAVAEPGEPGEPGPGNGPAGEAGAGGQGTPAGESPAGPQENREDDS